MTDETAWTDEARAIRLAEREAAIIVVAQWIAPPVGWVFEKDFEAWLNRRYPATTGAHAHGAAGGTRTRMTAAYWMARVGCRVKAR